MDTFTCTVDLNGEHLMVLQKRGVSPAELIVLKRSNGSTNVMEIFKDGTSNTTPDEERVRLKEAYGDKPVELSFGSYGDLPMKIEEAKIPDSHFKVVPKKAAKPKVKKADAVKKEPVKTEE